MAEPTQDQNLHLPSLVIKNFRGIDELTIPRLGRVTLLAGKNGVGKTTVLDAVRVWAARGQRLRSIRCLLARGDVLSNRQKRGVNSALGRPRRFSLIAATHRRSQISIGPNSDAATLRRSVNGKSRLRNRPDQPTELEARS